MLPACLLWPWLCGTSGRGAGSWSVSSFRVGWVVASPLRCWSAVAGLKIGLGDYCDREDRDTQHQGPCGTEVRHSVRDRDRVKESVSVSKKRWKGVECVFCVTKVRF